MTQTSPNQFCHTGCHDHSNDSGIPCGRTPKNCRHSAANRKRSCAYRAAATWPPSPFTAVEAGIGISASLQSRNQKENKEQKESRKQKGKHSHKDKKEKRCRGCSQEAARGRQESDENPQASLTPPHCLRNGSAEARLRCKFRPSPLFPRWLALDTRVGFICNRVN